jgi:putative SOS response-associated peptidase YedK
MPDSGGWVLRVEARGKEKLPYCFTLADDAVFVFAGLWEHWKNAQGQTVESCTILTTAPNEMVRDVHDRMPAILAPESYALWLDPGVTRVEEVLPLLKPYSGAMRRYRVSSRVNHVTCDDAECAAEVEAA